MKATLIKIARYLTTETQSKKHGGYQIYKDDKIKIAYDTYYPNVHVNVFIGGKSELAAIYSGHGHTQEFHGGAWTDYVEKVLGPKAVEAEVIYLKEQEEEKERRDAIRNKRLDDSRVFA